MSYPTLAVNSGPLFIRTVGNGSFSNTYLLNQYDKPFSANYVLTTSNNGLLTPTRDPFLNTLLVASTITASKGVYQTLSTTTISSMICSTSTLSTQTLQAVSASLSTLTIASTVTVSGPVLYTRNIRNITDNSAFYTLNTSDWWSRHIFVFNSSSDTNLVLPLMDPLPPDGTFMYITNGVSVFNVIVNNLQGGSQTLSYLSTTGVIFNSAVGNWYAFS